MISIILETLLILGISAATGRDGLKDEEPKPYLSKAFPVANQSRININVAGGSTIIHRVTGKQVKLELYAEWRNQETAGGTVEDALTHYQVVMEKKDDTLYAKVVPADPARPTDANLNVWFVIHVPRVVKCHLENESEIRLGSGFQQWHPDNAKYWGIVNF